MLVEALDAYDYTSNITKSYCYLSLCRTGRFKLR
jgi:hypothetical protein